MTSNSNKCVCLYCDTQYTNQGVTRHLSACDQRQNALDQAADQQDDQEIYHLKVQETWDSPYLLHLEIRGSTLLEDLDRFLRAIWLECCNHLSSFYAGSRHNRREVLNDTPVRSAFQRDDELTYIYDFGTESRLQIELIDTRNSPAVTEHPVELMARNRPPTHDCMDCDQNASHLCFACQRETDKTGLICEEHWDTHASHDIGDPEPIANSPRFGLCGYSGPAEPPY